MGIVAVGAISIGSAFGASGTTSLTTVSLTSFSSLTSVVLTSFFGSSLDGESRSPLVSVILLTSIVGLLMPSCTSGGSSVSDLKVCTGENCASSVLFKLTTVDSRCFRVAAISASNSSRLTLVLKNDLKAEFGSGALILVEETVVEADMTVVAVVDSGGL